MIWVLLEEYNDYDQHGEYFVHAWDHKPTREELAVHVKEVRRPGADDYLTFVLEGGGRLTKGYSYDNQWYILRSVK